MLFRGSVRKELLLILPIRTSSTGNSPNEWGMNEVAALTFSRLHMSPYKFMSQLNESEMGASDE